MSVRAKDRYARLAGRFWRHPKVLGLSDSAGWLWTRALSFQVDQLTDGRVTRSLLKTLGHRTGRAADELVDAGLWDRDGEDYVFHDYADHNLTTGQWEAEKARKAKNKRDSRAAQDGDVTASVTTHVTGDSDRAGAVLSDAGRRTQDAGLSEREGSDTPAADPPILGRLLGGFRERHNAKTATTGNPIASMHLDRAREIAADYDGRPDDLDASLDGYFATDDKFVLKTRWSFKVWSNDPGRWAPMKPEAQPTTRASYDPRQDDPRTHEERLIQQAWIAKGCP